MKNILILLLLSLALQNTQAQQPITFERTYSDSGVVEGRRIRQTFDGGYIIAGRRTPPSVFFGNDGTLMKTDSPGNVEWLKVYGTPLDDDWFDDVQQTTDSGFIACGYLPVLGMAENIYIVKTDKNGDTLWTKVWGSNNYDMARSVKQTYDGGYVVAGQRDTTGVILRLNPQGDTLWTKQTYNGRVTLYYIEQTTDSGFVATGILNTQTINLNYQTYIIRLDKHGNTLWEKNYGYEGPEEGRSIKVLPDGNFIVGGFSWQPPNHYDAYLLKLDANGDTLWTKLFSAPSENGIVELTFTDIEVIVFCETQFTPPDSQSDITKTDSMGNFLWRREYGGALPEQTYGITICRDSGFALCALSQSFGILPKKYVVKTNENGLLTALVKIKDDKTVTIKVGPNPFEDNINLYLSELPQQDYQVILFDVLGQVILAETVQGGNTTILSMSKQLPATTYFLQIQDKEKILLSIPVIHY